MSAGLLSSIGGSAAGGAASGAAGSALGSAAAGGAAGAAGGATGSSLASGLAAGAGGGGGGGSGGGGGWLGTGLFKNDQYNPAPNNTNPASGPVASQSAMPHAKAPSTPIALAMLQQLPLSSIV